MKHMLSSVVLLLASSVAITTSATSQVSTESIHYTSIDRLTQDTPLQTRVTLNMKDVPLKDVLAEIDRQVGGLRLSYSPTAVPLGKKVSIHVTNTPSRDALEVILTGTNLRIQHGPEGQVLLVPDGKNTVVTIANGIVTGVVLDSTTKTPIPNVTVTLLGTKLSTLTGSNGNFRLTNVPPGEYSLSIKAVGYGTRTIRIVVSAGKEASTTILLRQTTTTLSEVVTTATGKQRRIEIPTDIVKINADEIRERTPVRSVIDIIDAAQIPGILVTRSSGELGAPSRIRIRGIGSISQSNDPVMIVDGVWIDASSSTRIDDIDPASIETVEIVRGPSAATLYGQDASNGVIVITTKRGKAGPTRWNLSYKRDWGQTYGRQPLFYRGVGHSSLRVGQVACPISDVLNYKCTQDTVLVFDPNSALLSKEGVETNNRYVVQVDGGAPSVTYSFTFSTGNTIGIRRLSEIDMIRYRLIGFRPPSEFLQPSSLTRNNVTGNIVLNPRKNLNLALTATGTQSNLKNNSIANSWSGFLDNTTVFNSFYALDTLFAPTGYGRMTVGEYPSSSLSGLISSNIQYWPNKSTTVSANLGTEKTANNSSGYRRDTQCRISEECVDQLGYRDESSASNSVHTVRLNATTTLDLGPLNKVLELRPSIGGDYKKTDYRMISLSKSDIPVGDRTMGSGKISNATSTLQGNALAGWYLSSTIGLFRRIYFDVGIRQDIGSAITSSKDAMYPKIGGSWLVSDEGFWRTNSLVSSLRLRSAIGHAAVQPSISDIDGKFVNGVDFIDGRFVNTVDLVSTGNNRLQPERAIELEVGFDADMFNDRLSLTGTYAHKENRNTLIVRSLPQSFGIAVGGSRKENVAKVRNRDFELSANGRAIETQNMLLILQYTLTLRDNQVMTLGDGVAPFRGPGENSRIAAGYPLGAAWGKVVLGYDDVNQDGMLSIDEMIVADSMVYKGWSQPRYQAGYGVSFTVNNRLTFDSRFAYKSRYVQSYRKQPGPGAEDVNAPLPVQAASILREFSVQRPVSDLRWNSASITFNLPNSMLKRFGGRSLAISIQGSNLGLWTNYTGRDPGVNSSLLQGDESSIDSGDSPPSPRLFVLDFRVGF